jgi:hypothetical protein
MGGVNMARGQYWIVIFDTETGGGIAFVPNSNSQEEAAALVKENIHYDWKVIEAKVIGVTSEIDVSNLHYHKTGIYHYGGDSNI